MSHTAFGWADESGAHPQAPPFKPILPAGELPPAVAAALWHGCELGSSTLATISSRWDGLDAELPGGGWPLRNLTEVLCAQPSLLEWRLLAPSLSAIVSKKRDIIVVGPPKRPHLPGLAQAGIDERHLVWIDVGAPAERLWATEQLVRANAGGAVLSWLPQARPEQIRRLQVASQGCDGPVFLLRPESARNEASAAPLRVLASFDVDWHVNVRVIKRRGATHDGCVVLDSIPSGIEAVLTPRLRKPSTVSSRRGITADALGSASSSEHRRHHVSVS